MMACLLGSSDHAAREKETQSQPWDWLVVMVRTREDRPAAALCCGMGALYIFRSMDSRDLHRPHRSFSGFIPTLPFLLFSIHSLWDYHMVQRHCWSWQELWYCKTNQLSLLFVMTSQIIEVKYFRKPGWSSRSGVQVHPYLHSEFEASLGYMWPCLDFLIPLQKHSVPFDGHSELGMVVHACNPST